MFARNIDFIAVFFIAVSLFAISKLDSLRIATADAVRIQNAIRVQSCPTGEVVSRIQAALGR